MATPKYAADNGATSGKALYTATWGFKINESMARRFKDKCLKRLKKEISEQSKQQAEINKASDGEENN